MTTEKKQPRKDTRKGDRHRPGYFADYQRDLRARIKAQKLASGGPKTS